MDELQAKLEKWKERADTGKNNRSESLFFNVLAFDSWFVVVVVNNSGPHGLAIFQLIFVKTLVDLGYNMIHIDLNYLNT